MLDLAAGDMEVVGSGFSGYDDSYPDGNENLSIDLQSLIDLLDGKPSHAPQVRALNEFFGNCRFGSWFLRGWSDDAELCG